MNGSRKSRRVTAKKRFIALGLAAMVGLTPAAIASACGVGQGGWAKGHDKAVQRCKEMMQKQTSQDGATTATSQPASNSARLSLARVSSSKDPADEDSTEETTKGEETKSSARHDQSAKTQQSNNEPSMNHGREQFCSRLLQQDAKKVRAHKHTKDSSSKDPGKSTTSTPIGVPTTTEDPKTNVPVFTIITLPVNENVPTTESPATPEVTAAPITVVITTPPVTSAPVTSAPKVADANYAGDVVDTDYGPVQVQITVSNGTITAVKALQSPNGDSKSVSINQNAIPKLETAALQAKSANIATVSGATYTSEGFKKSLQSALTKANL